jgi:hypothetical protein
LLGDKFADIEEKYDLTETSDGFGEEGEEGESDGDEFGSEESSEEDF